jgi:uncharacterized protein YjiS (DUF1127 family)
MTNFWRERMAAWLREPALYLAGSVQSRWRQAEALDALDDRLLRDIGLSALEARIGHPIKPAGLGNWPLSGPSDRGDRTAPAPRHGLAPTRRYW